MAKVKRPNKFVWQYSLLHDHIRTLAHTPRDGGETTWIKFQDGKLYKHMGPGDWFPMANVRLDMGDPTELEFDLLNSVLKQMGYVPGNVNDL